MQYFACLSLMGFRTTEIRFETGSLFFVLPLAFPCDLPPAGFIGRFLFVIHVSVPGLQQIMVVFPAS